MSAFCRICVAGLSAFSREAAGRAAIGGVANRGKRNHHRAMMRELRGAGGSGGNWTSTGAPTVPRGDSQSMAFRLTKNETATTAIPSRIV